MTHVYTDLALNEVQNLENDDLLDVFCNIDFDELMNFDFLTTNQSNKSELKDLDDIFSASEDNIDVTTLSDVSSMTDQINESRKKPKRVKATRTINRAIRYTCLRCPTKAHFTDFNKSIPLYCKTHMDEDMVNVYRRKCMLCDNRAFFGHDFPIYCFSHKTDKMSNYQTSRCNFCSRFAIYNFPGEKYAKLCSNHKTDEMVNVKTRRCKLCDKSCYQILSDLNEGYCYVHRKVISEEKTENKKCLDCDLFATHGIIIETHCFYHKTDLMKIYKKLCIKCGNLGRAKNRKSMALCKKHFYET